MHLLNPISVLSKLRSSLRVRYLKRLGVEIGRSTYISPKAFIDTHKGSRIIIGHNCYITRHVIILNHSDVLIGGPERKWEKYGGERIQKDVIIGNNVFIGVSSTIMPGIVIGDNVIVGANCLVNKDIPCGYVVAGVPCKVITTTKEFLKNKLNKFDEDDWEKSCGS